MLIASVGRAQPARQRRQRRLRPPSLPVSGFRGFASSTLHPPRRTRMPAGKLFSYRIMAGFWCPHTCPCVQLNGKHEAVHPPACAAPATVNKRRFRRLAISRYHCAFAWEGEAVRLASPDTGQDRWKCADGDLRDTNGVCRCRYLRCRSVYSACVFLFNPAHGEVGWVHAHLTKTSS